MPKSAGGELFSLANGRLLLLTSQQQVSSLDFVSSFHLVLCAITHGVGNPVNNLYVAGDNCARFGGRWLKTNLLLNAQQSPGITAPG